MKIPTPFLHKIQHVLSISISMVSHLTITCLLYSQVVVISWPVHHVIIYYTYIAKDKDGTIRE